MSARGIVESEIWRSEQLEGAERESDPPNPAVGETWVRIDIQPAVDNAQTLGALRIQGQGGVLQVPIIDINDQPGLGPDVYVGPRFFFGEYANDGLTGLGPVGFIPVTDQGGSKGSPRVVTPAGVEYESHDALELSAIPDSVVSRPDDNQSGSWGGTSQQGIIINPNIDLTEIEVTISSLTQGVPEVRLIEQSSSTGLDSVTGTFSSGDIVTLTGDIQSGTEYRIVGDDRNGDWTQSGYYDSPIFPYTSEAVDIVAGYADGRDAYGYTWQIKSVKPIA